MKNKLDFCCIDVYYEREKENSIMNSLKYWKTKLKSIAPWTTPMDNNKFMKVLIACGVTYEQLRDYEWFIEPYNGIPHKYHCMGFHPTFARIDIIKENIIV